MNLKFEKCEFMGIDLEKYDSFNSLYLGKFLIDGGRLWNKHFKEWAISETLIEAECNDTYLEKENGYIYVCDLFIDEPRNGPCYKISIPDFVDLLEQWGKALNKKPDAITITEENGKLIVTTQENKER